MDGPVSAAARPARDLRARARSLLDGAEPIAQLAARLTMGVVFATSGWGKVRHLEKVTAYFTELKIPAPEFQAPLVAFTELICGALLVVGLATRLAVLPLMVTMLVAIVAARRVDVHGVADFFGLLEWTYFVLLFWIATRGPGAVAVDRLLAPGAASSRTAHRTGDR